MSSIRPEKWLGSAWTAKRPENGEKHFVVKQVIPSRECVVLEAISTGRRFEIAWRELQAGADWFAGWR